METEQQQQGAAIQERSKDEQLAVFRAEHGGTKLTTNQAVRVSSTDDSLKAGDRGPTLMENLNKRKMKNIDLLQNEESLIPLEDSMVNGVLLAFVAHELNDPQAFLHEINRVLIPEGRLIIVEFSKEQTIMGPPLDHRLSEEQVDVWTNDAGLKKGGSWRWSKAVLGWEFLK